MVKNLVPGKLRTELLHLHNGLNIHAHLSGLYQLVHNAPGARVVAVTTNAVLPDFAYSTSKTSKTDGG